MKTRTSPITAPNDKNSWGFWRTARIRENPAPPVDDLRTYIPSSSRGVRTEKGCTLMGSPTNVHPTLITFRTKHGITALVHQVLLPNVPEYGLVLQLPNQHQYLLIQDLQTEVGQPEE